MAIVKTQAVPGAAMSTPVLEACSRCGKLPSRQDYHCKKLPVGTPGRHVARILCDCGCKMATSYFVMDRQKIKPRTTASLLFVAALPEESLTHNPVIELLDWATPEELLLQEKLKEVFA